MRKILFILAPLFVLTFVAYSHFTGASGVVAPCLSSSVPWIGQEFSTESVDVAPLPADAPVLRAVVLNIHSGMGDFKGLWSWKKAVEQRLDAMAAEIARAAVEPADIVALNEVDFSARRSGNMDQALYLAQALEKRTGSPYRVVYGRTKQKRFPAGGYGNAVLVRHAVTATSSCLFDDIEGCGGAVAPEGMPNLRTEEFVSSVLREERGFIKLSIDFYGRPLDVIVTHLEAVATQEREAQAAHLLRRFVDPRRTTVVLGDMNAVPTPMTRTRPFAEADRTHDILTSGSLADARVLLGARLQRADFGEWSTFPAQTPAWPLDMALASLDLYPQEVRVMDALDTDHRGFFVAYRLLNNDTSISAQRARHDAIRRRQLAQIVECDMNPGTPAAKHRWLQGGTLFSTLPNDPIAASPL